MRIALLDCFSGISGDMLLGALIDAGASVAEIKRGLNALKLPAWGWRVTRVKRGQFRGTRVEVFMRGSKRTTIAAAMKRARSSRLPGEVKSRAESVIKKLLAAEGRVHGVMPQNVHLHEIENLDTVVDVYGSLLGLRLLKVDRVFSSTINVGSGTVLGGHGLIPVPAPGTAELLKSREILVGNAGGEMTTPTGAALLAGICSEGPPPPFVLAKIGYGVGARTDTPLPNMLRVMVGELRQSVISDRVCQVECVVDDMNPQLVEVFLERVYRAGAREAWSAPVNMKKQRLGVGLVVLVDEEKLPEIVTAFLEETGTLGVRISRPERVCLARRIVHMRTKWGKVRVKLAGRGRTFHAIPEYADIKRLAHRAGLPVRLVMDWVKGQLGRRRTPPGGD